MSDKNNPASSAPLNPQTTILDTEIQQISAEDFKRNIDAAAQAASDLWNLKLPKSLKEIVDTLAKTILKTKRSEFTHLFSCPQLITLIHIQFCYLLTSLGRNRRDPGRGRYQDPHIFSVQPFINHSPENNQTTQETHQSQSHAQAG